MMVMPLSDSRLQCGRFELSFQRPLIMGVLNLTPDSFSDGGQYDSPAAALTRARQMQDEGADLIDVGGESTRPGAAAVSLAQERLRVLPIVEKLSKELSIPLSVDTSKPELMREVIQAGAGMINDVNGLQADGAAEVLAQNPQVACVLMHMRGQPRSMQSNPQYQNVVLEVSAYLQQRRCSVVEAGVLAQQCVLDPGIGFGKTLAHNLALLKNIPQLVEDLGPLLIGVSRKSMFAHLLGERPPQQRIAASVQAALLAAQAGAAILRVHDVRQTREALQLLNAIQTA